MSRLAAPWITVLVLVVLIPVVYAEDDFYYDDYSYDDIGSSYNSDFDTWDYMMFDFSLEGIPADMDVTISEDGYPVFYDTADEDAYPIEIQDGGVTMSSLEDGTPVFEFPEFAQMAVKTPDGDSVIKFLMPGKFYFGGLESLPPSGEALVAYDKGDDQWQMVGAIEMDFQGIKVSNAEGLDYRLTEEAMPDRLDLLAMTDDGQQFKIVCDADGCTGIDESGCGSGTTGAVIKDITGLGFWQDCKEVIAKVRDCIDPDEECVVAAKVEGQTKKLWDSVIGGTSLTAEQAQVKAEQSGKDYQSLGNVKGQIELGEKVNIPQAQYIIDKFIADGLPLFRVQTYDPETKKPLGVYPSKVVFLRNVPGKGSGVFAVEP